MPLNAPGGGHVRIHDLGHAATPIMPIAGVPMALVSQILGHSDISVTCPIYGRFQPSHMLAGIEHLTFGTPRQTRSRAHRTRGHLAEIRWALDLMVGDEGFEPPTSSM